jgi:hypothetical protein
MALEGKNLGTQSSSNLQQKRGRKAPLFFLLAAAFQAALRRGHARGHVPLGGARRPRRDALDVEAARAGQQRAHTAAGAAAG